MSSTENYDLPQMIHMIQESYPNIWDQRHLSDLLPSLLLALITRDTNLILSTPQPPQLQKSVVKLLSLVFGLQVKKVKVRSALSAVQLLESLFVSTTSGSTSSSLRKRRSRVSFSRSLSAPRPPSSTFTEYSDVATASAFLPRHDIRLPRYKTDSVVQYDRDHQVSSPLPQVVVISDLERAGRCAHLALADALRGRRIVMDSGTWNLPSGFFVIDISTIRDPSERPDIHPTLLDHFAFSATLPAHGNNYTSSSSPPSPLPRSYPLPSPSPSPSPNPRLPLFPYDKLPSPDVVYVSPFITNYTTALLTAARHHPELDGLLLTARCVKDAERIIRTSALVFRHDERMMLTEAHVRRVIPPILAHRLRVRDNPREHIMGILSDDACARNWSKNQQEQIKSDRRSIKTILAEILTEV